MTDLFQPLPDPEVEALKAQLQQATEDNVALMKQHQMGLDDLSIVKLWVSVLLDTVLGPAETPARLRYELALQAKTKEIIEGSASQVARQRLLQGVNLGNGGRP